MLRDMTHPDGGFYASEDADSEGKEGTFYVWTPAEVKAVLGESDGAMACRAYGVTERGNFEHGTTVLSRAVELDTLEEAHLEGLRDKLLQRAPAGPSRPRREHPHGLEHPHDPGALRRLPSHGNGCPFGSGETRR